MTMMSTATGSRYTAIFVPARNPIMIRAKIVPSTVKVWRPSRLPRPALRVARQPP